MSKDPILFNGGDTNLYGYVLNDPINFIDMEGTNRRAATEGGGGGPMSLPARFSPNQTSFFDLLKGVQRQRPLTPEEGKIFESWAREYRIPFRGPEIHETRFFNEWHHHFGPKNHVPACIGPTK